MTLGTDQRAHLLVHGLLNILPLSLEGFDHSGTGDAQSHGLTVMAILAADGIDHLRAQAVPLVFLKYANTHLVHQPGNIRTFTRPTGSSVAGPGTQRLSYVLYSIIVSCGLIVVP